MRRHRKWSVLQISVYDGYLKAFSATSPLNFSSQLSKANRARGVTPLLPGNGVTLTVTETIPWVRDGK